MWLQVLSPQFGEQIKGDFAEAIKVGEVDLSANSSAKLTGQSLLALLNVANGLVYMAHAI